MSDQSDNDHSGHEHSRHEHGDRGRAACGDHGHGAHAGHAGHGHAPKDFGRAFAIGTALNLGFVLIEATCGFLANSMALLADAGHNLSDVFGLLMAWSAAALAKKAPTERFTYGMGSTSILAALANAILLLIAVGAIAWEAMQRFATPEPVVGSTVMIVAGIGILINGFTAWLFVSGREDDLNIRGAYLHMAADAAVSLGVVVAGGLMLWTSWHWIDPVVSLIIAAVIVWGTWQLLSESVNLALHAVPPGIDAAGVQRYLSALPGVDRTHDLHIWAMSTTETALTCHLVMPGKHPGDAFLLQVTDELRHRFKIAHATLQIEHGDAGLCALEGGHKGAAVEAKH